MNDKDFKILKNIYQTYKKELRSEHMMRHRTPESFKMLRELVHGEATQRDMFDTSFASVQNVEKGG